MDEILQYLEDQMTDRLPTLLEIGTLFHIGILEGWSILKPRDIMNISKLFPQDVYIPGDRIKMREEDFFGFWVTQHRRKIHECRKKIFQDTKSERVLLDTTFFDLALALYANHPEVIEENNN